MKDLDTNKLAENAFGALGKAEDTLANLDYSGIQDEKIRAQLELARLQGTAKAGGRSTIVIGLIVTIIAVAGGIYFIQKGGKTELPTGTVNQTNNGTSTGGDVTGSNNISY